MFNPTTAQRVNERYRRLLLGSGWILPESGAELTLNYDFVAQPNLDPQINPFTGAPAGPTLNFVRGTTKSFPDWEGTLRTVLSGEATFAGCRRVENLALHSTAFDNAVWLASGTATKTGSTVLNFPATNDQVLQTMSNDSDIGESLTASITLSGTGTITLRLTDFSNETLVQVTLTTTPTRYQINRPTMLTNDIGFGLKKISGDTATTVTVADAQVENVSGQADTSPSEYIATTTVIVAQTFPLQKNGLPFPTAARGLQINETRTNISIQSEDLTGTGWTIGAGQITIDVNDSIAPDGALTMDKMKITASGGGHFINKSNTYVSGTTYTYSWFAKADEHSFIKIAFPNSGFVAGIQAYFNLTTGVVGTIVGAMEATSIEAFGNGIYRCSATLTSDESTTGNITLHITETDGGSGFTGVAGEGLFLWGLQLEVGNFPTSYIPTVASSVTRNIDTISTTDLSWYNDLSGTLYMSADATGSRTSIVAQLDVAGSTSNRMYFFHNTTFLGRWTITNAGGDNAALSSGIAFTGNARVAIGIATDNVDLYLNGTRTGGGDQDVDPIIGIDNFRIGSRASQGDPWNGFIRSVRYYNARGFNTELEDLSLGLLDP